MTTRQWQSYPKRDVDEEAEREGNAMKQQRDVGNLDSGPVKKRKRSGVRNMDSAEQRARKLLKPARSRDSFRKTGE